MAFGMGQADDARKASNRVGEAITDMMTSIDRVAHSIKTTNRILEKIDTMYAEDKIGPVSYIATLIDILALVMGHDNRGCDENVINQE